MANIVTSTEVRNAIGIDSAIITDTKIDSLITETQAKSLSLFNVYLTPTKVLEIQDGNNKNTIQLNKPYVWKVLKIQTRNDTIDLANITFNPFSSIISIDSTKNPYYFYAYPNSVKIKYLSAFMEKTNTITESDADVTAGTSVVISVDDESNFSSDDWVLIEGIDGNREAAKITSTSSGQIIVDELVQNHESESLIIKLDTHRLLKDFILYESAVAAGINSIGASYTFNTSYNLGSLSANRGIPYPHFEKNVNSNIKLRDSVKFQIFNKLNAIS